jgi:NADP-dependent 3-hydroxy acid dehydrogenase YdfG
MADDTSLAAKLALVTGAGSGIGAAIAVGLSRAGFNLIALGRNREHLAQVRAACVGRSVCMETVDLNQPMEVHHFSRRMRESLQGLDVLVHSAGVFAGGTLEQTPVDELDRAYRVNVRAPYEITRALLPALRARAGQVVFVNSSAVAAPKASGGVYCMTKTALRVMADTLRQEVSSSGVRVLSVFPGRTNTPMQHGIFASEGRAWCPEMLLQPEDIAGAVLHSLNLPATAELTDLHIRPRVNHAGV